ncbi:tetratricopeptide repeat protein 39A-like isoform X2 [Limulus polyphemus]|uniref:Tetratricopeptide repeat protein 39A-like isoform X2 n=1 Tax=Limulus polyphemus TaxID=6850 RepID=A0ABM1C4Z3_LIMPO|nr:tetratricopeptide repeat protein 39A-like isoform X2 [Limulus polyphemus]
MSGCDSEDEMFEDALDEGAASCLDSEHWELPLDPQKEVVGKSLVEEGSWDLQEVLDETIGALDLFLNNKFNESLSIISSRAHTSIYHGVGRGMVLFIQAVMTMETSDIDLAMDALKQAVKVSQRYRKKVSTVSRIFHRPDYNTYTEVEVHAELIYAECLLMNAILTFVYDQSLLTFLKGGIRIRSCYQSYKECLHILKTRNFEDEGRKRHFESGVCMGVGAFNLMISQLPTRVLKLLEFIGFSGNKMFGQKQLEEGCNLRDGLRSPLCVIILSGFHTYVVYALGLCDGDLGLCEKHIKKMLKKYPKGALYLFCDARLKQLQGKVDEAIQTYDDSIKAQQEWRQFHYMCFWEKIWCYCYKCDWVNAANCCDTLCKECRWSPATYYYLYGCFLYMQMLDGKTSLLEEIVNTFKKVPELKQKFAGKSAPIEKFCVKRAEKFFRQDQQLTLPIVEVLYLWHGFPVLAKAPHLLRVYLHMIESNVSKAKKAKENHEAVDDYYMLTLLRGVVLKYLDCPLQAEEYFKEIVRNEKEIKEDSFIPPYAAGELAIMFTEQGRNSEASQWLHLARHNYHGYLTEVMLHFRLHAVHKKLQATNHLFTELQEASTPSRRHSLQQTTDHYLMVDTPKVLDFSLSGLEPSLANKSKNHLAPPDSLRSVVGQ